MPRTNPIQVAPKLKFLLAYFLLIGVLGGIKGAFPDVTTWRISSLWSPEEVAQPLHPIAVHSQRIDSLFRKPRPRLALLDRQGRPVVHPIQSVASFDTAFPDLNPVQLATAHQIGVPACANREAAIAHSQHLVYVGDHPFYEVDDLTHSIPYLVPRAATLLDQIGRAFIDSLATKGLPFHRIVVSSVLRTDDDIARLRTRNRNASENSCHRFGTTFDIAYNRYLRVQDPALAEQPMADGVRLKSILAEVLNDLRRRGACYVKYEKHQACFHITAR
ncbi:MAG: hypothetical protein HUK09_00235 [Bacteroidaceae bacterium]|nr:hypothetical protein [Bacteroidaceae bacterium]